MIARVLPPDVLRPLMTKLSGANRRVQQRFPGESGRRQPVHVVYGGAHLFKADTAARLGVAARRALDGYAGDAALFGEAIGLPPALATTIYGRVREKLAREPVEDFRLDFEDGYGNRPDAEEDAHAAAAAREVAAAASAGQAPPYLGIRIKPLNDELRDRAVRTLDIFVSETIAARSGRLPDNFVVTLPKITARGQVALLADTFVRIERAHSLPEDALRMELMVETPYSIFDDRGAVALPMLVREGRGRVTAAHFGTYDYTAALGITAAHQHMAHPACDFAKHVMQVALAGTGVALSDGATNVLPVAPHRPGPRGELPAALRAENRRVVHAAWRLHATHVRRSRTERHAPTRDSRPPASRSVGRT
jgi:hypothetical protein